MRRAVGLDAAAGGWAVVALEDGAVVDVSWAASAAEVLRRHPADAYGIDIPLGLLDEPRGADLAAKRALGRRGSTVFLTPTASALSAETYAEANRRQRELVGSGLSAQAWALKERIVDAATLGGDERVHEVHPELLFARLAGAPLEPKRSWDGLHRRRRLLAGIGVRLPDVLGGTGGRLPADDLLDAAAAAVVADHVILGSSPRFPEPPTQRSGGRLVVIRG